MFLQLLSDNNKRRHQEERILPRAKNFLNKGVTERLFFNVTKYVEYFYELWQKKQLQEETDTVVRDKK
jgi:hypothetical protein